MFDRILETDQISDIILKVISKDVPLPSINYSSTYTRSNFRNRFEIVSPQHQLRRERQKKVHDYSEKSIDVFKFIVVDSSPKLTSKEGISIETYFGYSSQHQTI